MHGLEFTGPEVDAISFAGTIGIDEYDGQFSNQDGREPSTWQSHPSTIGYVRGNQSSGTSAGTQGALMDSGTREGTPADELTRLSNTDGETELNPTSAQPGPTPRSEQQAATPAATSASAAANPGNVGNKDGANAAAADVGGGAGAGGGTAASKTARRRQDSTVWRTGGLTTCSSFLAQSILMISTMAGVARMVVAARMQMAVGSCRAQDHGTTGAGGGPLLPEVEKAYAGVPEELRSPGYHGDCAEGRSISAAIADGADVTGGKMVVRALEVLIMANR